MWAFISNNYHGPGRKPIRPFSSLLPISYTYRNIYLTLTNNKICMDLTLFNKKMIYNNNNFDKFICILFAYFQIICILFAYFRNSYA